MLQQVYKRQLFLEFRRNSLVMSEVYGYMKKESQNSVELPLPSGLIHGDQLIDKGHILNLINDGMKKLKLKPLETKVVLFFKTSFTQMAEISYIEGDNLAALAVQKISVRTGQDALGIRHSVFPMGRTAHGEKRAVLFYTRTDWIREIVELLDQTSLHLTGAEVHYQSIPELLSLIPPDRRGYGGLINVTHNRIELGFFEHAQILDFQVYELNEGPNPQAIRAWMQKVFADFRDQYQGGESLDLLYACASVELGSILDLATESFGLQWLRLDPIKKIYTLSKEGTFGAGAPSTGNGLGKKGGAKSPRKATTVVGPLPGSKAGGNKDMMRYIAYAVVLAALAAVFFMEP